MALYLVTGGAGFIGSHLAAALAARGDRIRIVDNLSTGKRRNLEIARALATEGSLLLLDEPAAGLNARETADLTDLIRRIRQNKELIGHIHVAGVPGRGELDAKQEVNFPACMEALLEVGYTGYVGQEFIPTRDPYAGLRQAVSLCDV